MIQTYSTMRMKNPYPSISLEEAYKWITRLKDKINSSRSVDRKTLRSALGLPPTSGMADNVIGSLTHYGLLDRPKKSSYRISDLAFQILQSRFKSSEWKFLAIKAATSPELFNYLYNHFGSDLPVDLDKTLQDGERIEYRNINSENVTKILNNYLDSLRFVGARDDSEPTKKHVKEESDKPSSDSYIDIDLGDGITIKVQKKVLLEIYEQEAKRIREKLLG